MKLKRLAALTTTFVLLGAGIVYANSPWGKYEGYDRVGILLNGSTVAVGEVPGFLMNGRVVMPLRALTDSLNAMVKWDDQKRTVDMYKPNVHMIVAQSIGKNDSLNTPFGLVEKGKTMDFVVAAQVDNLQTSIHSFKIELIAPDGTVLRSSDPVALEDSRNSFWYNWPVKGLTFDAAGSYKIVFSMKLADSQSYTIISEKLITSA